MAIDSKKKSKNKQNFVCNKCNAQYSKWAGRCNQCGEWNTLEEKQIASSRKGWTGAEASLPLELDRIVLKEDEERWNTEVEELDRVVGGGIVKGSVGLLGGTPGVGKSTLLLQILARLVKINKKVLYVSGEESAAQIRARSDRLNIDKSNILIYIESSLEEIQKQISLNKPDFVVIDSIQTLYTEEFQASAGSVTQVRESAAILLQQAKQSGVTVMLIGHVTKGGDIAGPKTLEHMVDYVLYLEGEKDQTRRVLRAVKNRFGPVNEVGLFKMTQRGLAENNRPNAYFMEKYSSRHPGMAIFPAVEGTRTLLMEVQSLVGDTSQNYPARTTMGIDRNKLQVIVAVLEKHLGMDLSQLDIYLNLAGGFKIIEPAVDLAIIAALLSSHLNYTLPERSLFFGEVALTGELRPVNYFEDRVKEAIRCGFEQLIVPKNDSQKKKYQSYPVKIIEVANVQELLNFISP